MMRMVYRKATRRDAEAIAAAALSFFTSIGALAPRVGGDLRYELPR